MKNSYKTIDLYDLHKQKSEPSKSVMHKCFVWALFAFGWMAIIWVTLIVSGMVFGGSK